MNSQNINILVIASANALIEQVKIAHMQAE